MSQQPQQTVQKSILDLSHIDALAFFIKSKNYFTLDIPPYFCFDNLLSKLDTFLRSKEYRSFTESPRLAGNINYTILSNKDGKYAWRPFQIINPILYIALIHKLTAPANWELIQKRFNDFSVNSNLECLSIPVISNSDRSGRATQILYWWQSIEQKSIELSIDYDYLFETDITDCYGSIYTHSIPWALHTKTVAKKFKNDKNLLGNIIDSLIQDMSYGQTNGIPQGSIVMDLIAEIVLGDADTKLLEQIHTANISDYHILRYRDDYRIFVNNPQDGEKILKLITETMIDLGLKLSPIKTREYADIICASIKKDKRDWLFREKTAKTFQKQLLIIHDHSRQFPNSGSLVRALSEYYKKLLKINRKLDDAFVMISIVVDIALNSPKTYPLCAAIISKFLNFIETQEERKTVLKKIKKKFEKIPNTGHMQIWLQRVSYPIDNTYVYNEKICSCLDSLENILWDTSWINSVDLKKIINCSIVDKEILNSINEVIPLDDVQPFLTY